MIADVKQNYIKNNTQIAPYKLKYKQSKKCGIVRNKRKAKL